MARLGDVCEISVSAKPVLAESVWLLNLDMIEQQTGNILSYNYVPVSELDGSIIQFDTANVLYSKLRPNLNKVVVPSENGFATSELLPLKPDTNLLCREYLAAYLRSYNFVSWAVSKTAGAKMPRLGTKELLGKDIPLPPLDTQRHIAALLDKISDLIALRKRQLSKLDELVKARFVEMFGDPVANGKGWPVAPIEEVAEVKIGPFGSLLHKEDYIEGIHALVNPSHIVDDKICVDNKLSVTREKYEELSAYHLMPGDVVLGRRGEMGRCAVVYREGLLCGTGSMILRVDGRIIRPYFLQAILSNPTYKRYIEDKAVGVTMQNLNVPIVSSLLIPLYPPEKQVEYINLLYHADMEKNTIRKSIRALETLKSALMQEYFG